MRNEDTVKHVSEYEKNRLLSLALVWEGIRRNPNYWRDYNRQLELKAAAIQKSVMLMKDGAKDQFLDPLLKGDLGASLLSRCKITRFEDPEYSFVNAFFRNNHFVYDEAAASRLEDLFDDFSVRCKEEFRDLGFKYWSSPSGFRYVPAPPSKLITNRHHLNVQISIRKKKSEILFKISRLIDKYKVARYENKLESLPKKKSRFKALENVRIFETYDLVQKNAKRGRIDWRSVAAERFKGDAGQSSNRIKKAKREYAQAKNLIIRGIGHID